jgi:hypothetical protein
MRVTVDPGVQRNAVLRVPFARVEDDLVDRLLAASTGDRRMRL